MRDLVMTAVAGVVGLAVWAACIWAVSLFVEIPPAVLAFWVVLLVTIGLLGLVPLHGFHWDSLKAGVALGVALWVGIGVMGTPWLTLLVGTLIVGLCLAPGVMAAGLIFAGQDRGEETRPEGTPPTQG